jgi:hypothetical protein
MDFLGVSAGVSCRNSMIDATTGGATTGGAPTGDATTIDAPTGGARPTRRPAARRVT